MTAVERLLAVAAGEVGYLEKKSAAQLDHKTANAGSANYTKYARDLDAVKGFYNGRKQGASWCDVFVDWCFVQAFGVETAVKLLCQVMGGCGAGCRYSAQYYKAKGRFFEDAPAPGDQIFFVSRKGLTVTGWLHTGIVTTVAGGYVYTIEGNTSGASGVIANGGGVCRKKYKLNSSSIGGYGRPDWSLAKEEWEMTDKEVTKLVQNAVKSAVENAVAEAVKPLDEALANAIQSLPTKTYHKVAELPGWAKAPVERLIAAGIIQGDGKSEINLTDGPATLGDVSLADKLWLAMAGNEE